MRGRARKQLAGALLGAFLLTGAPNTPANAQVIRCIGGTLFSVSPGFAPFNLGIACSNIDLDFLRKVLLQAIVIGNIRGRLPTIEEVFLATGSESPEAREFLRKFGEFTFNFQRLQGFANELNDALANAGVDNPFGPENRQRLEQRRQAVNRQLGELINEHRINQRAEQQAENVRNRHEAALRDAQQNLQNAVNAQDETKRDSPVFTQITDRQNRLSDLDRQIAQAQSDLQVHRVTYLTYYDSSGLGDAVFPTPGNFARLSVAGDLGDKVEQALRRVNELVGQRVAIQNEITRLGQQAATVLNDPTVQNAQNAVNQAQNQVRNSRRRLDGSRQEGARTARQIQDLHREGQIIDFLGSRT